MDKVRIQEIAAEAGMSNNDMLEKAKVLGYDVKEAQSSINLDQAAALMDYVMTGQTPAVLANQKNIDYKLEETIIKLKNLEKISKYSSEKNKELEYEKKRLLQEKSSLEEKLTLLEKKIEKEKEKETKSIETIIKFLAAMPQEISNEQIYLEKRRKRFTQFGGFFLSLGVLLALGLIGNILLENKLQLPVIDKLSQYLAYALSIGFPMGISLLFYRQANIKSKEIEKINEKSILVQQVENALNSYNVLLSGDELKKKTISSIDRVIDKVFENGHKDEKSSAPEESKLTISDAQKLFKIGADLTKN